LASTPGGSEAPGKRAAENARGSPLRSRQCLASTGAFIARPGFISDGLALVEELLSGAQLADDLLGCVALAFHGASPGQVWPLGKLS